LDLQETCDRCGGGGKIANAESTDGFGDCDVCQGEGLVWNPLGKLLERFVVAVEKIAQEYNYRRK
jgi:hypothetical protein